MSTSKEYKEYIIEQLSTLKGITYRPMMGEYLLYYNNTLFGGIYDDRLLIKKTTNNKIYNLPESIPYKGAKSMYIIEDTDNIEILNKIIEETCKDLKKEKK